MGILLYSFTVHFVCLVVLCIFVAFVFRVNGFLLALRVSNTFFSEELLFSGCILRQVFQRYWDWPCHCMARSEDRVNYRMRPTHRLPSICNHCYSLQLLCSGAISQIMSHSVFSVKFLGFFMWKPVCRTFPIYCYMCIFAACVMCMHKDQATSLLGFLSYKFLRFWALSQ